MDFGTWYAHVTRRADLRLRDRVHTLMQGTHGSTFRGRGEDFEFFQPHGLGEDTAHIDWKASERLEDGLLVRRLREERVLEVWIAPTSAVDGHRLVQRGLQAATASRPYGDIGRSVIGQQDLLGFVGFDRDIRTVVQPFRSEKTFVNLLKTIWDHQPESGDATSLLPALRFFETQEGASQQKKKRLLLLLSDFETEDEWLSMARALRNAPGVPSYVRRGTGDTCRPQPAFTTATSRAASCNCRRALVRAAARKTGTSQEHRLAFENSVLAGCSVATDFQRGCEIDTFKLNAREQPLHNGGGRVNVLQPATSKVIDSGLGQNVEAKDPGGLHTQAARLSIKDLSS